MNHKHESTNLVTRSKLCNHCGHRNLKYYKSTTTCCRDCTLTLQKERNKGIQAKLAYAKRVKAGAIAASQAKYRKTPKGQLVTKALRQKFKENGKAKEYARAHRQRHFVTREVLARNFFAACENCIENLDGLGGASCSVANGSEELCMCPVWLEWKESGIHPVSGSGGRHYKSTHPYPWTAEEDHYE